MNSGSARILDSTVRAVDEAGGQGDEIARDVRREQSLQAQEAHRVHELCI